jgi:hypothetical protein
LPGLCSLTYKILQPLIHLLSYIPIQSIAFLPIGYVTAYFNKSFTLLYSHVPL